MPPQTDHAFDRRSLLGLAGLGAASIAGCSAERSPVASRAPASSPGTTTTAPGSVTGPSPSPPSSHADITHGARSRADVALTFHGAGDPGLVDRLISVTQRDSAHVTVLAVGQWAAANPDIARRLQDAGHEVGNHTWSHQTMTRLTNRQIRDEIDRAAAELQVQTGTIGAWFRPSGTPHSTAAIRAAAQHAGYPACLSYDVDSLDYTDPGPKAIVQTVMAGVQPGSIVSLHLGHPGTLVALPLVLTALRRRGLRAVTAGELLRPA